MAAEPPGQFCCHCPSWDVPYTSDNSIGHFQNDFVNLKNKNSTVQTSLYAKHIAVNQSCNNATCRLENIYVCSCITWSRYTCLLTLNFIILEKWDAYERQRIQKPTYPSVPIVTCWYSWLLAVINHTKYFHYYPAAMMQTGQEGFDDAADVGELKELQTLTQQYKAMEWKSSCKK